MDYSKYIFPLVLRLECILILIIKYYLLFTFLTETICMDIWSNIYAKQKKDFYLFIHILDIGILWHKYLYYELILLHHLQLFYDIENSSEYIDI